MDRKRSVFEVSTTNRIIIGVCVWYALSLSPTFAGDRLAIWRVVHDRCVVAQLLKRDPSPCEMVDLTDDGIRGYAILKDLVGRAQFLLIPTKQIPGIESPGLLKPDSPNYWQKAWSARKYVIGRVGRDLPRSTVGMAVNSAMTRSQDQLHIHIDCVQPTVASLLREHIADVTQDWAELGFDLSGRRYIAKRVVSADLEGINPFLLLAEGIEAARADMARQTLVVVGARFADGEDGFILLAGHGDPSTGNTANGEDLLDHSCTLSDALPRMLPVINQQGPGETLRVSRQP
jgi:CDP-diacylglycerol pyrophosphatase